MLYIARRYLFSKKSHSVINIIAGVSLVSVATPVAAIIILLSIFNGFGGLVEGMNETIDADLTISPSLGRYFDSRSLDTTALRGVEGVESFAFMREQTLMLAHGGREAVVTFRGVDDDYTSVVSIAEHMRAGEFRVRLGDLDRLVLGNAMAAKLGLRSFNLSEVEIYSLKESRLNSFVPLVDFVRDSAKVSGVYLLDMESENRYVYGSLRLLNRLMRGDSSEISSVVVKSQVGYSIEKLREDLRGVVGDDYKIERREELNPMMYDIIRYEKWGIIFISIMVMLLASFSLIGIVAMLIIEKRDDMLTLRMMGATWSDIRWIFFQQGMLISGIGSCVGMVVGVVVTLVQQYVGVVKLPSSGFVIDTYPVDLQLMDVVGVLTLSIGVAAVLNYIVTLEMIKRK